ncbi:FAD/NAD(P)-binding domain-containing protein [Calocera cornea HHB12733]|uniref:FAD/NAD(P)-binding domain-containing protein n=1 Tax=Calocera cornea HHB12733 TaxID=1353952 RepID=A0A165EZT8_9BASI|nr:FAD/NAD(P)-binding domain-containing protein [Calocera cornea HHB12733]
MGDLPPSEKPAPGPLRIAILGGGIVGLTLALALAQQQQQQLSDPPAPGSNTPVPPPFTFTLYESAAHFSEIGAGIMIGWNALKVLRALGVGEEYEALARGCWLEGGGQAVGRDGEGLFFQFRFGDGRRGGEPFFTMRTPGGQMNTHRAELLELLLAHVPASCVKFQKQLIRYSQQPGGSITVAFRDGTQEECDVLLGADGIKSTVRKLMYEARGDLALQEPRWSGSYAYRALVPTEKVLAAVGRTITSTPMMWLAPSQHAVHYPVAGGKYINVVAFKSDYTKGRCPTWETQDWVEHDVDEKELMKDYEGCASQVKAILELVKRPSRWAMFDVPDLPYFVQGDVALLGDAAHAMTPHQGNGASQGIEDAHLLAHLLAHPKVTPDNVSAALKAYELVRKDRVQRIKELSYETGRLWELVSPAGDNVTEFARVAEDRMDWIWSVDISKQLQTAVAWFEMSLA